MLTSFFLMSVLTLAQAFSPTQVAVAGTIPVVLNNGPCLDSPRGVPQVLQDPVVRATQVVRIDKIISTSSMTQGEVIGFVYTLEDGTTWLGQRTPQYMSPAQASEINQVLASTHSAGTNVTEFPPQMRLGVKTKFVQFFRVSIPPSSMSALHVEIDPCVSWPNSLALPDPSM